jgi:hypothetical protein
MGEGKTLRELLVERAESTRSADGGLDEQIKYQAVCTVRWCLLFHRHETVTVGNPDAHGEMYAVELEDRALDEALNWLPAELITRNDGPGAPLVRVVDLDGYLTAHR